MLKIIHVVLAFSALLGFSARVLLVMRHSALLQCAWLKIVPHVIDTLLLISGLMLVVQGRWLNGEYAWLLAKMIALSGYIGFGIWVMRSHGKARLLAFAGALSCFVYILAVAASKKPLLFL